MNKRIIIYTTIILFAFNFIIGCKSTNVKKSTTPGTAEVQTAKPERKMNFNFNKNNDPEFKILSSVVLDKFVQLEYKDTETGKTMHYNLSVPNGYDKSKQYPLVMFIADASTPGKDTKTLLTQGYGGLVWASSESQSKNPCIVMVPQYTKPTVNDASETTDEVEMTVRLLNNVVEKYNIDKGRLYTTGQSMGGMMSMYFNITHPDLFAASIFVSCQWDVAKMKVFSNKHFFYIVAAGDEKVPKGMVVIETVLTDAKISAAEWSAKLTESEQERKVQKLFSENNNINFITFTKGSVLPAEGSGMEHMLSFDYAYKLKGVGDWLFKQKK